MHSTDNQAVVSKVTKVPSFIPVHTGKPERLGF